jgi:hypothetical protein
MLAAALSLAITLAVICTILALVDRHLAKHAGRDLSSDLANRRSLAARDDEAWGDVVVVPADLKTRFHSQGDKL